LRKKYQNIQTQILQKGKQRDLCFENIKMTVRDNIYKQYETTGEQRATLRE